MAAIEDADPVPLEDFEPDFPPDIERGRDDSLVAAFDDWDSEPKAPPSMQIVNLLTELLSLVEAWRTEGVNSNNRLETRLVGELRDVQSDLVTIRTSETESHLDYRQALRSLWQQTQELSTGVQDLAAETKGGDAGSAQIVSELALLKERIAEISIGLQQQEHAIAGRFSALETKVQEADARAEHLAQQADEIQQRLNEGLEVLEARSTAALESQEALQGRIVRVLEAFDERMAGRHEQFNERTGELQAGLQSVEKSVADGREGIESSLAKGLEAMDAKRQELETRLTEGMLKALADARQNAEAGLAKGLGAVSASQQALQATLESLLRQSQDESAEKSEQLAKDLKNGFASLEPSRDEMKAGFSTLSQAVEDLKKDLSSAGERQKSSLLERLSTLETEVGKSLSTGAEEREQLKHAVSMVSDALKQVRTEAREEAGHSEIRIRRQLESVESQTLQAIAEVCNSLLREQRAAKLDLETRIDRGVREPLKTTVTLLNRQLNEIEATVDRTFDALRNADLTIRIDSMDALLESRVRNRKPEGVVVLPSGAEAPAARKEEETKG